MRDARCEEAVWCELPVERRKLGFGRRKMGTDDGWLIDRGSHPSVVCGFPSRKVGNVSGLHKPGIAGRSQSKFN